MDIYLIGGSALAAGTILGLVISNARSEWNERSADVANREAAEARGLYRAAADDAELWKQSEATARKHHDRCADALATLRARVDRALAAETPGAAPAAKRLCRILRGEA